MYFIYGNHYCLNVSCMPEGEAGGVLLRAMEPVFGMEAMARARGLELAPSPRPTQLRLISSGPGRMSQALGITRLRDNDKDLTAANRTFGLRTTAIAPSALQPRRESVSPKPSSSRYDS